MEWPQDATLRSVMSKTHCDGGSWGHPLRLTSQLMDRGFPPSLAWCRPGTCRMWTLRERCVITFWGLLMMLSVSSKKRCFSHKVWACTIQGGHTGRGRKKEEHLGSHKPLGVVWVSYAVLREQCPFLLLQILAPHLGAKMFNKKILNLPQLKAFL